PYRAPLEVSMPEEGPAEHQALRVGLTKQLLNEILDAWSSPNDRAIRVMKRLYARTLPGDKCLYYGRWGSSEDALGDKRDFCEKWPERYYHLDKIDSIQCHRTLSSCEIGVILSWQLKNRNRAASMSGVSRFAFDLDYHSSDFGIGTRIDSESAKV